jgi:hypothetical protein
MMLTIAELDLHSAATFIAHKFDTHVARVLHVVAVVVVLLQPTSAPRRG